MTARYSSDHSCCRRRRFKYSALATATFSFLACTTVGGWVITTNMIRNSGPTQSAESAIRVFWIVVCVSGLVAMAAAWMVASSRIRLPSVRRFGIQALLLVFFLCAAALAIVRHGTNYIREAEALSQAERTFLGTWVRNASPPLVMGKGKLEFHEDRRLVVTEWLDSAPTSSTYSWASAGGKMYLSSTDNGRHLGFKKLIFGLTPEHSWSQTEIEPPSSDPATLRAGAFVYRRKADLE